MHNSTTIGIIGFGVIGQSWSKLFAKAGYRVRVFDIRDDLDALISSLNKELQPSIPLESGDLKFVTGEASLVQENGPENLGAKQELFRSIFEFAPSDCILATSSSGIPASDIIRGLPEEIGKQVLVGHPFNPPELMPLVEVVPSPRTDSAITKRALQLYTSVGKKPVEIKKEIHGFVANRVQKAVLKEAIYLVSEGIISPKDFDTAIMGSLGLRYSVIGPFLSAHQGNSEGISKFFEHIGPSFEEMQSPNIPLLSEQAREVYKKVEETYGRSASTESLKKRDADLKKRLNM